MHSHKEILLLIATTAFVFFLLISFIATLIVRNKKQQQKFHQELAIIRSNFDKELLRSQIEIQEETFQQVALELHDNISHFLSLAKLHLASNKFPVHKEVSEKIDAAALLIAYSLEEIRNIGKSLNTDHIKSNGLIKTVEQQIEHLNKSGQYAIHFSISGETCFLEDQKEIVLFRIFQESLNNIIKHSKADIIQIKMQFDERKLLLSIHDNGVGFSIDKYVKSKIHSSSGIKNIIKRSVLINATHEILTNPGEGTTINIITPY